MKTILCTLCGSVVAALALTLTPQSAISASAGDAERISRTENIQLDEIEEELDFQSHFMSVAGPVIDRNYDTYAASTFTGPDSAVIAFVDDLRQTDIDTLNSIGGVTIQTNARFTAVEAADLMASMTSELSKIDTISGTSSVVTDPVTGRTTVTTPEPLRQQDQTSLRTSAVQTMRSVDKNSSSNKLHRSHSYQYDVVFETDSTSDINLNAVSGGEKLTISGTTRHECTAAFPAKNVDGATGLVTAGHCADNLTVDYGNRLYTATHRRSASAGDGQFHRSREGVSPRFRYDWGKYRPVDRHSAIVTGSWACRFGAKTGQGSRCVRVKEPSVCIYYKDEGKQYCHLTVTEDWTGEQNGDSGGPWYHNNIALGIHSGHGTVDGITRSFFYSTHTYFRQASLTPVTAG